VGQITIAAILGGTISSVSGGKFANGAVTAAMSYAFGQMGRSGSRRLHGGRATTGSATEDEIRAVWERMRGYPEIAAIEAEKGAFNLVVDHSLASSEYDPTTHTIRFQPGDLGLDYRTMVPDFLEAKWDKLSDSQWRAAVDAYPDWAPFSVERILFHEAQHALQPAVGMAYTANPGRFERPVIQTTNEFMYRNYGQPYRSLDHTAVRVRR